MSQQLRLEGLNKQIRGSFYLSRATVQFESQYLVRQQHKTIRTWAKPVMKYIRDPDVESFETLSVNSGEQKDQPQPKPKSLEYRITGITWYTPRFVNTCNIDSFLSAWVRKMRQSHGKYLKHVTVIDRVGSALYLSLIHI